MYIVAPVWIVRGGTSYLLKSAQLQRLHLHPLSGFSAPRPHTCCEALRALAEVFLVGRLRRRVGRREEGGEGGGGGGGGYV